MFNIGGEAGQGILDRPDAAFTLLFEGPGFCEVCAVTLGPDRGFAGSGPLYRLKFSVLDSSPANLALDGIKIRDFLNNEVGESDGFTEDVLNTAVGSHLARSDQPTFSASPTPFHASTALHLDLPKESSIVLSVVDVTGRRGAEFRQQAHSFCIARARMGRAAPRRACACFTKRLSTGNPGTGDSGSGNR